MITAKDFVAEQFTSKGTFGIWTVGFDQVDRPAIWTELAGEDVLAIRVRDEEDEEISRKNLLVERIPGQDFDADEWASLATWKVSVDGFSPDSLRLVLYAAVDRFPIHLYAINVEPYRYAANWLVDAQREEFAEAHREKLELSAVVMVDEGLTPPQ